ncbi:putative serine/threonine-protein kinase iks1 [Arthrobotrys musiformis]|uniref:non-specific serine/threonine protein kinase n=1 Tax=Arthrobotrys musiformis TaxID=47236 RepID=A0AAV9W6H9_9PEZI
MDSIVPYRGDSSSVVLRHENSLVVYDHQSRQLALRSTSPPGPHDAPTLRAPTCPYCHQTISEDLAEEIRRDSAASAHAHRRDHSSSGSGGGANSSDDTAGFITPEYFRILTARLLPDSNTANNTHLSPPGSPRRRIPGLVGVATSGTSTPPSPIEDGRGATARERYGRSRSSSAHGISSSAFSPGYFNQFFVKEKELGKGGKGVVLLVRHVLDGVNLGLFACKRVPVGDDHEWLAKVLQEVQLLQQLSHQNLVSYRHAWLEDMQISNFGPSVPCAFILQQYCNSGDLQNYVYEKKSTITNDQIKAQLRMRRLSKNGRSPGNTTDSSPKLLPLDQVITFFRDIAAGLSHLHSNGFIHRDLKPSNCLLHDTGVLGSGLRVLVSDFGEVQREDAKRKSTGATGTISYCAPEVLRRVGPNGELGNFSTKSDIFSLGMILHFMCFAKLPYINSDEENEENEEIDKLKEEISGWQGYGSAPYDKYRSSRVDIPEKLFRSLGRLLSVEPAKRPSAADILGGIRGEFGFAEDGVSRRTPVSPKPPNLSLADDDRFHRISPVSSGPNTPVINPSNSITRARNGPLSGKQHTRKSSKLREITSQFSLPEPVSTSNPSSSPHNGSPNAGELFGGPLESRVRTPQVVGVSNDSSSSSSDAEGPLVPVRTLSSSLILRPKGAASPRALPEKPHLSDEDDEGDGDSDDDDYEGSEGFGIGIEMGKVGRSMVMTTGNEMKIPALTAPVVVGGAGRGAPWWVRVPPQVWLAAKVLLFFGKVFSVMERCSPVTPNPWVFNSLLMLALVDLFGPFLTTMTPILFVLHLAAYYFALKFDALCATDGGGGIHFLQLGGWAAGE